ncbi:MAG TPA: serine--tRNA ligase [Ignavibacteria bacterium]|nr:serine--tRNA ligase [Ignavibacteria bacterium]HMQ98513.1 serine--tRNA ligase [Ignavibacteria bacterium]
MLDLKLIRENPELIKQKLEARNMSADSVEKILALDMKRREYIGEVEKLKSLRNTVSQEIAKMKKGGANADDKIADMKKVSDDIKAIDDKLAETEKNIDNILRDIPNIAEDSVPLGKTSDDNVQFKIHGEKALGDFKFLDHVELGKKLDILDFGIGAKISGSGFPFYKGKGAILERALINFMLDTHKSNGYTEVGMPFLVNRESMEAAEKVPKFEEDMYRTVPDDLFAIPTAEVPIVNIHRDEVMDAKTFPVKYCGYTACFRREAGSYGKDTKGFLRVHQFNKVELINFCLPEESYAQMEEMLSHACGILEALNIHYRVVNVCTGDMGFAASKQYDIEVWSPAENKWLEASSVSNCTDFQSRRAMIRFKRDKKTEYVHILNGSGLATSRLYVSLIESNQTPEGKIIIPKVLQPYTGFDTIG